MASRQAELRRRILRALDELGARDATFAGTRNNHLVVQFVVADRAIRYVFAKSPGDVRTVHNTIAGIRRAAYLALEGC